VAYNFHKGSAGSAGADFLTKNRKMNKSTFLCLLAPLFVFQAAFAQQPFSDAEITYAVKVDLPSGASPQLAAAFEDSRLVYSFKNYLFRSDMNVGKTTYTNIHNSRNNSAITLIDAGPNKYLIRMSAADLAKESARFDGLRYTNEPGEKQIAGYSCKKALGKLSDGSSFTVYYSPELIPEFKDFSPRFKGLDGFPLAFEMTTSHHLKMTMTATSVSIAPQPTAKFQTPTSGYRAMSYTELENLRNRK
jgi:GLPGLI family protein